MNKLKIIIYRWIEYGKIYKGLSPYEMNLLPYIYYDLIDKGEAIFLNQHIAELLLKLKFDVIPDKFGINFIAKIRGK